MLTLLLPVLSCAVMLGFGNSLSLYAGIVLLQRVFERRRGLAAGLAMSGGGVGTAIFGCVIPLAVRGAGLQCTLRALAALVACGNAAAGLMFTDMGGGGGGGGGARTLHQDGDHLAHEAVNPLPVCSHKSSLLGSAPKSVHEAARDADMPQRARSCPELVGVERVKCASAQLEDKSGPAPPPWRRQFVSVCNNASKSHFVFLGVFIASFGLYVPIVFVLEFAEQYGTSIGEAEKAVLVSCTGFGSILFRVAWSCLSDIMGYRVTAVIILYLYGLVSISAGQGVSFLGVHGSYPIKTLALYAVCW
jgi:MFS family permease